MNMRIVMLALALLISGTMSANAQGSTLFRSVPGELAARPRGGVIDLFDRPAAATARNTSDLDNWFWREISPARDAFDRQRMTQAGALAATGRYGAPPRHRFVGLLDEHGAALQAAAGAHGLSLPLLMALVMVESGGTADAVSGAGAVGLMQLMPATAALMQVADATDPRQNVMGGARYLSQMLAAHDADVVLALAAYNAGPGAVARAGGVPRFAETRAYVPKVLAAWYSARQLCVVPPRDATGPCEVTR